MAVIRFLISSVLFGIGLAMDAFSVSLANGLNEPKMKRSRAFQIAGTFAGFQTAMPLLGWFLVRTIAETFTAFQRWIPWVALVLLLWIGGGMILDGIKHPEGEPADDPQCGDSHRQVPEPKGSGDGCNVSTTIEVAEKPGLSFGKLMLQGVATSIDALSVGFTIADYRAPEAVGEALIIGAVTFVICLIGLRLGRTFGAKLAGKASILGGSILVLIGILNLVL